MLLVRLYQLTFASVFGGRCRFEPSCSAYAIEALHVHGAWRGGRLAVWRVMRCSPMCKGGHDPVPRRAGPPGLACHHGLARPTGLACDAPRQAPLPYRVEPDAA